MISRSHRKNDQERKWKCIWQIKNRRRLVVFFPFMDQTMWSGNGEHTMLLFYNSYVIVSLAHITAIGNLSQRCLSCFVFLISLRTMTQYQLKGKTISFNFPNCKTMHFFNMVQLWRWSQSFTCVLSELKYYNTSQMKQGKFPEFPMVVDFYSVWILFSEGKADTIWVKCSKIPEDIPVSAL